METLLPQLSLALQAARDPKEYFGSVSEVWLEIGFGGGEHLLWQAEANPSVGLIGAEPYVAGMAKLLSRIGSLSPIGGEDKGEGAMVAGSTPPHPDPLPPRGRGENIRLYMEDASDIIAALPGSSLGRVFILFPDPWPKTRHHKRRFIQMKMLDELARVMRPGAELRFATDDAGYLAWTLERLMAHRAFNWLAERPADWRARPQDWPQTRYETKALHGVPVFLRFARVA